MASAARSGVRRRDRRRWERLARAFGRSSFVRYQRPVVRNVDRDTAVTCDRPQMVILDEEHGSKVGVAKAGGALGDCVEDGLDVGRGRGDQAQDLGRSRLLFQRLIDLAVARLKLLVAPLQL